MKTTYFVAALAAIVVGQVDARVRGSSMDEDAKHRRLQNDDCKDSFKLSNSLTIPGGSSRARPSAGGMSEFLRLGAKATNAVATVD